MFRKVVDALFYGIVGIVTYVILVDIGERNIVRQCNEFQAFTYERAAWTCERLTPAGGVKSRALSPTGEGKEI